MTSTPKPIAGLLIFLVLTLWALPASAADPFRVGSKPPTSGLVTRTAELPAEDLLESPMLASLSGYLGQLKSKDFVALRRSLGKPIENPGSPTLIAVVHMTRGSTQPAPLGFFLHEDGSISVRPLDNPDAPSTQIDPKALGGRIPPIPPQTQLPAGDTEADRRFMLDHPHSPSTVTLNTKTRKSRFRANYPQLTRQLSAETIQARMPAGYDPDKPAGILIWISPRPDGRPPSIFEPICDELGLICVGVDNNGNKRPLTDRLQNHFDSIETLAARYRIDRQRIYLTGMSGGGRCSGILQCSFPEIFAGAVPIVGFDSYHNAPTGQGKKYWPARIGKPSSRWFKLLKQRRIAAITGSADFNEPEMVIRRDLMTRDGLNIRLDIIEGMGHTMPTADQFSDALRWADEPRREAIAENLARAHEMLDSYNKKFPDPDPDDPAQRKLLIEITIVSPWSDPGWQAAGLLGFERPD